MDSQIAVKISDRVTELHNVVHGLKSHIAERDDEIAQDLDQIRDAIRMLFELVVVVMEELEVETE